MGKPLSTEPSYFPKWPLPFARPIPSRFVLKIDGLAIDRIAPCTQDTKLFLQHNISCDPVSYSVDEFLVRVMPQGFSIIGNLIAANGSLCQFLVAK